MITLPIEILIPLLFGGCASKSNPIKPITFYTIEGHQISSEIDSVDAREAMMFVRKKSKDSIIWVGKPRQEEKQLYNLSQEKAIVIMTRKEKRTGTDGSGELFFLRRNVKTPWDLAGQVVWDE